MTKEEIRTEALKLLDEEFTTLWDCMDSESDLIRAGILCECHGIIMLLNRLLEVV